MRIRRCLDGAAGRPIMPGQEAELTTGPHNNNAKPLVFGIERVYNPHILPIFDELRRQSGIRFEGCVLQPQVPWRVNLGWPELPLDSLYLRMWESTENRRRYFEQVKAADVVIWPGLKHPRGVGMMRWRNRRRKPNVIWAERFIHRRKRSPVEVAGMKLTVRWLNSPNMHLMSLGPGADADYGAYGATRWNFWTMGYAVEPILNLNHNLAPAPDGIIRLLFVGELTRRKAVDVLLAALGQVPLKTLPWRLKLVGDGDQRPELEKATADLGLQSRVTFTGVLPKERLDEVYAESDVLILPSRFDGWGAVVNEAMEHGLAVVASDQVGAAAELVKEGVNGFGVPVEDASTLADRIARLIGDPSLCARMRAASRTRIDMFRPVQAAERMAAFCRGVSGLGPMPEFEDGWCRRLGSVKV